MFYRVTLTITTPSTTLTKTMPISAASSEEAASFAKSFIETNYRKNRRTEAKVKVLSVKPSNPSKWR